MTTWRWRRCPGCGVVLPASEFIYADEYGSTWDEGEANRECPQCGINAPTIDFVVVRERHPKVKVYPRPCPSCKGEHPPLETCAGMVYDFSAWPTYRKRKHARV